MLGSRRGSLRRPNAIETLLFCLDPCRHLIASTRSMFGILCRIMMLGDFEPAGYLRRQFCLSLLHAGIAHRFVTRGVCLQLCTIDSDVAKAHQASCAAKQENLQE
jgi:hypothetical protein